MAKLWEDMTAEEKLESMNARLDEIAGVVIELEKQIKRLQAEIARQKGGTSRPVLKLRSRS
jgi:peptidoglycan hydrolase CwlO-like protein